ncbi:MAG: 1-(5-phosphoribosyl)-5-[Oscillospiraceae bacterium]|nr:1-(5-phosphoribosyl)-5-[(5-phosphoribosylamino)methylideneamino]imidazole-4-carboxamide isomerase [Oscillospiraceae bacterium]
MIILPAIDIIEGKAVRLLRGDYDKKTVYSDDPVKLAIAFHMLGADEIHLVDLEGARDGGTPNFDTVEQIVEATELRAEIGGGIRDEETVKKYLDIGVSRVILGTAAVENRPLLRTLAAKYGDRIAVGIDVRDGFAAIKGWKEITNTRLEDLLLELDQMGIKTVICTDISKDGAMSGTNRELYSSLSGKYRMRLIASGGVSSIEDVAALRDMGLYGAIIGKAIYNGAIDLKEALRAAK